MSYCLSCGALIDEYDSAYYSRNMLCIPCYGRKASEVPMVSCGRCGVRIRQQEARERLGGSYCVYCGSELDRISRLPICPVCHKKVEDYSSSAVSPDGRTAHSSCTDNKKRLAVQEHLPSSARRRGESSIVGMMIGRIASLIA